MKKRIINIAAIFGLAVLVSVSACTPVSNCADGIQNGTETGVDCGGTCPACAVTATCTDGIMNGTETGVDCGGTCSPCTIAPTCTDGIMNGTETGVDCGGTCSPCASTLNYYPFAMNNQWIFAKSATIQDTTNITSEDIFNGNTWYYFGATPTVSASSTGTVETWNRKDGHNYIQRIVTNASTSAYIINVEPLEYIILKEDANVNDTWTANLTGVYHYTPIGTNPPFPDQTLTFSYEFKILEKGITHVVEGITYTDVIKVEKSFTQTGTTYIYNDYFAKDIGIIEQVIDGTSYSRLLSYTLY